MDTICSEQLVKAIEQGMAAAFEQSTAQCIREMNRVFHYYNRRWEARRQAGGGVGYDQNGQAAGQAYSSSPLSGLGAPLSRSSTPEPQRIARAPSPCPTPIGRGRGSNSEKKNIISPSSFSGVASHSNETTDLSKGILEEATHLSSQIESDADDHKNYLLNLHENQNNARQQTYKKNEAAQYNMSSVPQASKVAPYDFGVENGGAEFGNDVEEIRSLESEVVDYKFRLEKVFGEREGMEIDSEISQKLLCSQVSAEIHVQDGLVENKQAQEEGVSMEVKAAVGFETDTIQASNVLEGTGNGDLLVSPADTGLVDGSKLFFEYSSKPTGGESLGMDNASRLGHGSYRSMIVPSDWMCIICGCVNFPRRTSCFQCNEQKMEDAPPADMASSNPTGTGKRGGSGIFLAGKQVVPVNYEAEVSQQLLEASRCNDLIAAHESLVDPFVDVNYVGAVCLKVWKPDVVLCAPSEVRVHYEELQTDATVLFVADCKGNLAFERKLLGAGADVNQQQFKGYAAAEIDTEGHYEILEIQLKAGACQPACEKALLEQRGLENLLYHRPKVCGVVFSEIMELNFFSGFVKNGYAVTVDARLIGIIMTRSSNIRVLRTRLSKGGSIVMTLSGDGRESDNPVDKTGIG